MPPKKVSSDRYSLMSTGKFIDSRFYRRCTKAYNCLVVTNVDILYCCRAPKFPGFTSEHALYPVENTVDNNKNENVLGNEAC